MKYPLNIKLHNLLVVEIAPLQILRCLPNLCAGSQRMKGNTFGGTPASQHVSQLVPLRREFRRVVAHARTLKFNHVITFFIHLQFILITWAIRELRTYLDFKTIQSLLDVQRICLKELIEVVTPSQVCNGFTQERKNSANTDDEHCWYSDT